MEPQSMAMSSYNYRMLLLLCSLMCGIFVFLTDIAEAQNYQKTFRFNRSVLAGHTIRLSGFGSLNVDCTSNPVPTIRVIGSPRLGIITVKRGKTYLAYPQSNPRQRCSARKSPASIVYYRASKGAVGTDFVSIEAFFDSGFVYKADFTITIH